MRFGLWNSSVDWQHIFKSPEYYLESLREDAEIENGFKYVMSPEVRAKFANSTDIMMDIQVEFKHTVKNNLKAKTIIEKSIVQHALMCVENSDDLKQARLLSKELNEDIEFRVRIYCACLGNVTKNYRTWLIEDYLLKLTLEIGKQNRIKIMNEPD